MAVLGHFLDPEILGITWEWPLSMTTKVGQTNYGFQQRKRLTNTVVSHVSTLTVLQLQIYQMMTSKQVQSLITTFLTESWLHDNKIHTLLLNLKKK